MLKAKMTTFMEECANEFAMAFLMPKEAYLEQVRLHTDKHGMVNTKAVADYFHVSITDARNRGISLDVIRNF